MGKTKIEWCDYTINPVKGKCPMACPYCYARRLYDRFKWDEKIRLDIPAIQSVHSIKSPSRIFVGSTMELFGEWIPDEYYDYIWGMVKAKPQHTFIFLTKRPENLAKWSPFPPNCWVGVSSSDNEMAFNASCNLILVKAKVKFVSFEPLLGRIGNAVLDLLTDKRGINWVIIGQQTPVSAKTAPKIEWVKEIVEVADKAGIPVFLKNNLSALLETNPGIKLFADVPFRDSCFGLRQEFPNGQA